jgi:hypothetical protein
VRKASQANCPSSGGLLELMLPSWNCKSR